MFTLTDDCIEQVLLCAESLIIVEESTKEIVYANDYAKQWAKSDLIGEKCFKAIMGNSSVCPFCPKDIPGGHDKSGEEIFYAWDCYCCNRAMWVKIKSRMLNHDGIMYRIINLNAIDDTMNLNTDTVKEMAFQKKLLEENARMRAVLEYDATHDKLTGLFNKAKYISDLEIIYRDIDSVGVIFFDVNNLKTVNDLLGHEMGDKMIAKMGTAMMRNQSEQIRCYRFGGDEFVAVCINCQEETLQKFMNNVQASLDKLNTDDPKPICQAAVGSAYSNHVIDNIDELVKEADDRMYEDKKRKKAERKN